jgi:hypothetical protein
MIWRHVDRFKIETQAYFATLVPMIKGGRVVDRLLPS